jgi:adenosylcobinamide-GDP ribazoletransferase
MKYLSLALGFLTAIPIRTGAPQPGDMGRSAMWFPLIGFALGLILAAAYLLLSFLFPSLLAAALTVALWAALTGGLHLDGLADCCDGLLATTTPEHRLEIMRDPRLGSFGVIGLTLFLTLKILALASLPPFSLLALPLAACLSRWLILPVALQPQARPDGLGADFSRGLARPVIVLAALVPLAWLTLGLSFVIWRVTLAIAFAHLLTLALIVLAGNRLGGVTGDVFGLTVELAELTMLLTFAVHAPL